METSSTAVLMVIFAVAGVVFSLPASTPQPGVTPAATLSKTPNDGKGVTPPVAASSPKFPGNGNGVTSPVASPKFPNSGNGLTPPVGGSSNSPNSGNGVTPPVGGFSKSPNDGNGGLTGRPSIYGGTKSVTQSLNGFGTPFVGTNPPKNTPHYEGTKNTPEYIPGFTGRPGGGGQSVNPTSCQFPEDWQQGLRWWRGYVAENRNGGELAYRNYLYDVFSKDKIFVFEQLNPTKMKKRYQCLAAATVGVTRMYLMEVTDEGTGVTSLECRQYAQADVILLLRSINPGNGSPRGQAGVENCVAVMDAQRSYEALPKFDPDTGELPTKRCPFTAAVYQAVVKEQVPGGVDTHCSNVPDSRVIVKDATMDVQTCRKEDTYDKPFFSSLYCVSDWEGSLLSDRFGSQAASDKSILLMYGTNTNGDRPHFYIAKYRSEPNGVIKLNLHVANHRIIKGMLTATAENYGESYKQFILKMQESLPALSDSVTNPTPSQDECGGCQSGICQSNSGTYQCVCKPGYGGQHCNQVLSSGSCNVNPCMNGGVCEQHGEYYYCRCADTHSGFNCGVPKYCSPNPCKHGECQPSLGGFHCLCPDGFTGRTCAKHLVLEAEEDKKILIILSTLLSVFGVAVVVVTVIICQCKRKKSDKAIPKNPDGDLPNQTYSSMTSWFPTYKKELAAQEETSGHGL